MHIINIHLHILNSERRKISLDFKIIIDNCYNKFFNYYYYKHNVYFIYFSGNNFSSRSIEVKTLLIRIHYRWCIQKITSEFELSKELLI